MLVLLLKHDVNSKTNCYDMNNKINTKLTLTQDILTKIINLSYFSQK